MASSNTNDIEESTPFPLPPITLAERVVVLKRGLNLHDSLFLTHQQKNVAKVIQLYETGDLKVGKEAWVMNGQLVNKEACKAPGQANFYEVCPSHLNPYLANILNSRHWKVLPN